MFNSEVRFVTPGSHTGLLGLLASPAGHSLSPLLHNAAIAELGLNYVYLAFDVQQTGLLAAMQGLRAIGARGWNISMPNKSAVVGMLDDWDPVVQVVEACNTVLNVDGKLVGYNTDGVGWADALEEAGVSIGNAEVTLVGGGGAAAAIAHEAAIRGAAAVNIFNRRDSHLDSIARVASRIEAVHRTRVSVWDLEDASALRDAVGRSSVLCNASPVGMGSLVDLLPVVDPVILRRDLFVSDVIYSPKETLLLRTARSKGARVSNGMEMMKHQAAHAFRLFTGVEMPPQVLARLSNEQYPSIRNPAVSS